MFARGLLSRCDIFDLLDIRLSQDVYQCPSPVSLYDPSGWIDSAMLPSPRRRQITPLCHQLVTRARFLGHVGKRPLDGTPVGGHPCGSVAQSVRGAATKRNPQTSARNHDSGNVELSRLKGIPFKNRMPAAAAPSGLAGLVSPRPAVILRQADVRHRRPTGDACTWCWASIGENRPSRAKGTATWKRSSDGVSCKVPC